MSLRNQNQLDEMDWRILRLVQQDASLLNHEIASRVHASPATCLRRLRRLHEQGFITRQVMVLNPAMLGLGLRAIVEVTLERQADDLLAAFELHITPEPEVLQCDRVSPGADFILTLAVTDMAAYHAFARRMLSSHANVRNVRTFFSIHCAKSTTALPLL